MDNLGKARVIVKNQAGNVYLTREFNDDTQTVHSLTAYLFFLPNQGYIITLELATNNPGVKAVNELFEVSWGEQEETGGVVL